MKGNYLIIRNSKFYVIWTN